MVSYEVMKEKGFKEVDIYGLDTDEVHRFCMENRMIPKEVYSDIESVMYSKRKTPLVLMNRELLGEEWEYWLFKIGTKREIVLMDGEIPELIQLLTIKEKEYIKEVTRRGKEAKAKRGGYKGGRVPYGYYLVNKKLYIDDYESFIVKFVFYRHIQGCNKSGIAKELNLRKFRTRNDGEFISANIESILKNKRLYQGYTTYEGKEIKTEFKGILEDTDELLTDEWKNRVFDNATEARISEHRKRYHSDNSVPNSIKPYILVGEDRGKKGRRDR